MSASPLQPPQRGRLVGAYLADAKAGPNGPEPTHFREAFRTRGPSNYAHGKQAGASHMYDYTDFDEAFVRDRVAQFRDQVDRRIDGSADRG